MTSPDERSVLIVGAGVAGVTAATALRRQGHRGTVTLVDAGTFPHDRPPLSTEYLAGTLDDAGISLGSQEFFDSQEITLRTETTVTALDAATGTVTLHHGEELVADRIVWATGGSAVRPADAHDALVLRTVDDAVRLRKHLMPGREVRVVGGGLLGAEIASTARSLGCRVTLLEPNPAPLSDVLGERFAAWWHAQHAAHGVTVETVAWAPGQDASELLILALGLRPDSDVAEAAGLEVAGGILVDDRQQTSHPRVLAIGDVSCPRGATRPVGHWDAAKNDGLRAAAVMGDRPLPKEQAPWFWSDRYGHRVDVVGSLAEADAVVDRGQFGTPPFAQAALRQGRLVGVVTVDDPRGARALRKRIGQQIDPDRFSDTAIDLRTL